MSNLEEANKNEKIKQQKQKFYKKLIIAVTLILLITVLFVVVMNNQKGTEIEYNVAIEMLEKGQIKEIYVKQNEIQIYYNNGEAHWFYVTDIFKNDFLTKYNDLPNEIIKPIFRIGNPTTISILSILYPILMIGLFIFLTSLIIRQFKGANNKSFEFVKNRARITPSKTKFSDVAGEDEEKEELEDVVDFLRNPKKYIELGAKIPKGVLLVGPPGTGKTLLARAVAGEAGVPFFTISGSDFMELFVGVGASRVRDLFETAKKAKPCIIFIDEIDAVGRQRGAGLGGGNDEREQTLNQLLVQMDGFEDNEGIIVMAATNRVDILDPALLRPGRFDRRVNISIPDIKGREEILKVHSKDKPLDEKIDMKTIARITSGFTGAEIENLLNEAAILVAKENRKIITEEDIQKSMMKVTLGPQKKSRVIDEKEKYNTAIHESGHAFIHKLAKIKTPVQEVSIIPRGFAGGYTLSADDDRMIYYKEGLICKIQSLLGGIAAEKLFIGDTSTGASNDLKRATNIARRMVSEWGMSGEIGMVYCGNDDEVFIGKTYQERMAYSENQAAKIDAEIKKIIDLCQKETENILTKNKEKMLVMADVLLEKETIYEEEIDLILAGKTKEEVIEYIENKDKEKTRKKSSAKKAEQTNKVDSLIEEAIKRESKIKKEQENKQPKTRKPRTTKKAESKEDK